MPPDNLPIASRRLRTPASPVRKPRRPIWGKVVLVVLFFFAVALASFIGFMLPLLSRFALLDAFLALSPTQALVAEANILVLGADEAFGTGRSDTIMVVHLNPAVKSANVISIPRDTLVNIPGRGQDKINHAYAYGGPELSRRSLEEFLGITIPYYVVIDIRGLANLIDELGGITVNVEKRMYYVDYAGGLYVNLWPGLQRLSGRDAVAYVRFRHDSDGDFGRIHRQQQFLSAIANELMSRKNIFRSPQLFLDMVSKVNTNLNSRQILGVALSMRAAMELGQISMVQTPGTDLMLDGVYYFKPDQTQLNDIANKYLRDKNPSGRGTT